MYGNMDPEHERFMEDHERDRVNFIHECERKRRAQPAPVQEPVALEAVYETIISWDEGGGKRSRRELARRIVDLYTTPPAAPVQETSIPEGWERRTVVGFDALVEALDYAERKGFMPDYIADAWEGFNYLAAEKHAQPAAQRQWVGLTGQQKNLIARISVDVFDAIHRTEAKLKEKNT